MAKNNHIYQSILSKVGSMGALLAISATLSLGIHAAMAAPAGPPTDASQNVIPNFNGLLITKGGKITLNDSNGQPKVEINGTNGQLLAAKGFGHFYVVDNSFKKKVIPAMKDNIPGVITDTVSCHPSDQVIACSGSLDAGARYDVDMRGSWRKSTTECSARFVNHTSSNTPELPMGAVATCFSPDGAGSGTTPPTGNNANNNGNGGNSGNNGGGVNGANNNSSLQNGALTPNSGTTTNNGGGVKNTLKPVNVVECEPGDPGCVSGALLNGNNGGPSTGGGELILPTNPGDEIAPAPELAPSPSSGVQPSGGSLVPSGVANPVTNPGVNGGLFQ